MTKTEEFLSRPSQLQRKIQELIERHNEIRQRASYPSLNSFEKVQTSREDRMADTVAELIEIDREMLSLVTQKHEAITEAVKLIDRLPDADCQIVLTGFYLSGYSMQKTADMADYATSYAYYLRRKAIAYLEKLD